MLLAININNTETKIGLFRGESLEAHWRLTTAPARTPDEWGAAFTAYLLQAGRSTQEVRAAIVASVVPPVTQGVLEAVERATTVRAAVVDGRTPLPIKLDVEEPLTVGADRILNTLAAVLLFHRDTIVVDFGTATTFDCITGDGRFIWPAHFAGIDTPYCQIEKLANLDALPRPHGFKVACFPIKVKRASAGFARVVAFVDA